MTVERSQLLDIARTVLNELGIRGYTDLHLTYAQKLGKEWRVNFTYTPSFSWGKSTGCFSIDEQTSEITFSAIDRVWKI